MGWVSKHSAPAREVIKYLKAERLRLVAKRRNAAFLRSHPNEPWPPLDLMVDAHAHADYQRYFESGLEHARIFADLFRKHFDFDRAAPVQIYEWGCGPGRILRHLHTFFDRSTVSIRASDYNPRSVAWCQAHFPDIGVFLNGVTPPLSLPAASIDIAYCRSVFTHLTDELCRAWMAELVRIIRPGGLVAFTTGGRHFAYRFHASEQEAYRRGEPVYREWDDVGRRDCFAWHPPQYVRRVLLSGLAELEHVPGPSRDQIQDVWLARAIK